MTTAADIIETLRSMADEEQAQQLMRFFRTGKGDYGEGDRFLGLKCPQSRTVVKAARLDVPRDEIERLLASEWHEVRFVGLMLIVEEMKDALPRRREWPATRGALRDDIAAFYLRHARRANNWDLVDMSCPKVLGEWLLYPGGDGTMPRRDILDRLVESDNLWEQRIGIVTTWRLIRAGQTADTLRLAEKLLDHPHDLIHKATGWMLREVGKQDMDALTDFLEARWHRMPRTALRYAIEKMDRATRLAWLQRKL